MPGSFAQVLREAEKAQKMAARKDYYAILGVAIDAGDQEIKRAYRSLAMRFHPDKASQAGISAEEAEARFVEIAEAYEVLADGEKRVAYDRGDDIQLGQGTGRIPRAWVPRRIPRRRRAALSF